MAANPYLDTVKFTKAKGMGVAIVGEDFLESGKTQQVFGKEDAVDQEEDEDEQVTYQYAENGGWSDYHSDAHGIVEAAFQDWRKNSAIAYRPIKSGQFIYRIDFGNYSQQNMQVPPHTTRNIRRVVGGVPQDEVQATPKKVAKKASPVKKKAPAKKKRSRKDSDEEDEDEDEEEEQKRQVPAPKKKAAPKKEAAASKKNSKSLSLFEDLTFCISGKLTEPRAHYEKLISDNGGKVAKSVTKAVTHVITADGDSASAKIVKVCLNEILVSCISCFVNY